MIDNTDELQGKLKEVIGKTVKEKFLEKYKHRIENILKIKEPKIK